MKVKMMVYDKDTGRMVSFSTYENLEDAANMLLTNHIPKGRYGKIESDDFVGEIRTTKQAEQLIKAKDVVKDYKEK